jgi:hypothetical protein
MEIIEEAGRRRQTIKLDNPGQAYSELRELLESRMSFDHVHEEKYYNDVEKGKVRARLYTEDGFDRHTAEKLEIHLTIDPEKGEMDLQVKGMLVTEYPEKYKYHQTVWYYAYRSLYDKFLYGSVREGYEHAVEDKLENLMQRVRETLET